MSSKVLSVRAIGPGPDLAADIARFVMRCSLVPFWEAAARRRDEIARRRGCRNRIVNNAVVYWPLSRGNFVFIFCGRKVSPARVREN